MQSKMQSRTRGVLSGVCLAGLTNKLVAGYLYCHTVPRPLLPPEEVIP